MSKNLLSILLISFCLSGCAKFRDNATSLLCNTVEMASRNCAERIADTL